MNRFYLVDKPLDFTSFDIIKILKKKLNIKKIGHSGTLDPLASGLLLIAVGNYTKLISYLEKDRKTYEFTVNLDGITDSFDLGEEVKFLDENLQKKYKKELTKENINQVLKQNFTGKINQVPPKYSAIKIDGKRAYSLARAGKDVNMKSREIEIFNIEIIDFSYPKLELKAEVQAGTYIRSIASDLGNILGIGGYITKLRRTKVGDLDVSLGKELDNFEENDFLDIKKLFSDKRFISLDSDILEKINNGLKVKGDFDFEIGEDLFVLKEDNITNIISYDGAYLRPLRKI